MTRLRRIVPLAGTSFARATLALLSLALLVPLGAGCSESHTPAGADGAVVTDGGVTDGGAVGCGDPPFVCVIGSGSSHACSDGVAMPGCLEGGTWQCPIGMTPEPIIDCWCYGAPPMPECVCLETTGWWCEGPADAGVGTDAGPGECPADPSSAEGMPCAPEGLSCGRCLDSCGWCNILSCNGGTWRRLEAFPPPPPCTSFDCGPELRCAAETEYCQRGISDIGGVPDDYACRPLPIGCPSPDACDCIGVGWSSCERGADGGLVVTYPGG